MISDILRNIGGNELMIHGIKTKCPVYDVPINKREELSETATKKGLEVKFVPISLIQEWHGASSNDNHNYVHDGQHEELVRSGNAAILRFPVRDRKFMYAILTTKTKKSSTLLESHFGHTGDYVPIEKRVTYLARAFNRM